MNLQATRKQVLAITKENPLLHTFPNRQQRRMREKPFRGNHKGVSLTVNGNIAYFRTTHFTPDGKTINHYVLKK